jgi:hypothetical protein
MRMLSRTALLADQQHQSYLTNDPSCFRHQENADRWQEHFLQKSLGISRNICFDKTPEFQNGEWQTYFPPMTVREPTFFEKWTRAKNARLQCQPTDRPKCFADFTPEHFPGPCGFSFF